MRRPSLSIIVAVKDAEPNIETITARLEPAMSDEVEVLFVTAGVAPASLSRAAPSFRVVESGPDALVPHLWRDGIVAARGAHVALTTAQCLPEPDWVGALQAADLNAYVGVGGVIDVDPACDNAHRAVFFQRYLGFSPPQRAHDTGDIAADNAVYRRAQILEHQDLLAEGFWEPSFHRRFELNGLKLRLEPSLKVVYRGCERPGDFAAHRFVHGRLYGAARSSVARPARRFQFLVTSPFIPIVLLARIVGRASDQSRLGWSFVSALPWSAAFILAWSAGEMFGYLDGVLPGRPKGVSQ